MKSQPDRRKIKGCWYVKQTYYKYWIDRLTAEKEVVKKELDDIRSAINFAVQHSKQY